MTIMIITMQSGARFHSTSLSGSYFQIPLGNQPESTITTFITIKSGIFQYKQF